MKKHRNAALKCAIEKAWDEPAAVPSATIANIYAAMLSFVRRAQAKAWEDGFATGNQYAFDLKVSGDNPYRRRTR